MNKQFNMTVNLTPADIKEAIAEYINRNFGDGVHVSSTDVIIDVGIRFEDRPCGGDFPELKGASIEVRKLGPYQDR